MNKAILLEPSNLDLSYDMGLSFRENLEQYVVESVYHYDTDIAWRYLSQSTIERDIQSIIIKEGINLLFYPIDYRMIVSIDFLKNISASVRVVAYIGDDEHYANLFYNTYLQAFDLILSPNYFPAVKYKSMGLNSHFFPSSFDNREYQTINSTQKKYQVSFVGNTHEKIGRKKFISDLAKSGIEVKVFGSGNNTQVLTRGEMLEVFSQTKINLNFTGVSSESIYDTDFKSSCLHKQIKGRCQEIALTGSFFLSEHAFGIERLFEPESEFALFTTSEELVEQVKYYLENDDEREAMAQKANARARKYYTSKFQWTSVKGMLEALNITDRKPLNVLYDRSYLSYQSKQVLIHSMTLVLNRSFREAIKEFSSLKISVFKNRLLLKMLKRELASFFYQKPTVRKLYRKLRNKWKKLI